jgi:hypothetical protein
MVLGFNLDAVFDFDRALALDFSRDLDFDFAPDLDFDHFARIVPSPDNSASFGRYFKQ